MGPSTVKLLAPVVLLSPITLASLVVSNFADLKIKTRREDPVNSDLETLYLKGPRQRREYLQNKPTKATFATISRCDERKRIDLNDDAKVYAELPIVDWAGQRKRSRPVAPTEMAGADVTMTTDSIDTGERRQQGAYTLGTSKSRSPWNRDLALRYLPAWKNATDGTSIYPASVAKIQASEFGFLSATFVPAGRRDHIHFKKLGSAPAGFPLDETITRTQQGKSTVSKLELLEFSEAPLGDALFQVPAGYSPALSTPHGGYDMTRPETLANRVHLYWAELKDWTRQWF